MVKTREKMVFPVDQFMQVKCKLQLTSESDSAESIQSTDSERIRLCSSSDLDKNASIIAMVCSNDNGNNHILVLYIEKRQNVNSKLPLKPRVIVKQIHYHNYNEDIVAMCIGESGNKLALLSSSATIYIVPIKNILLNLHAQQLRSSQGKSMYFYDASILNCCCKSVDDPVAVVHWKRALIVADRGGRLSFIDLDDKREAYSAQLRGEQISSMYTIQDNLIVVCANSNHQYRAHLADLGLKTGPNSSLEFHRIPNAFFYHPSTSLVSVVDDLNSRVNVSGTDSSTRAPGAGDTKLLRFYTSKQFFHRQAHKPQLVCKMPHLMANDGIKQLVLTDRFIAVATDSERCLIASRNCCDLKYLQSSTTTTIELKSLVKEINFNYEEKIMLLMKSPVSNDLDNIIDSFLLVTNRSLYSIEARYSCREMYINLIDSHLGISLHREAATLGQLKSLSINPDTIVTNSALTNSFLYYRDELYERICYDSRAFSLLFKLDLNSVYEAYGDRSLQRCQFELANRFFQMAKFGHTKILSKYLRVGAYKQAIDYICNILSGENEILDEKERIDLSRAAFDCLLAKTIVERSKTTLYEAKMKPERFRKLLDYHQSQVTVVGQSSGRAGNGGAWTHRQPSSSAQRNSSSMRRLNPSGPTHVRDDYRLLSNTLSGSFDLFRLCGHSPRAPDPKLSATTIVADHEEDNSGEQPDHHRDEEATLTSNTSDGSSSLPAAHRTTAEVHSDSSARLKVTLGARRPQSKRVTTRNHNKLPSGWSEQRALECEKALVEFVKILMPSSLYSYAMLQLIDFNLIELVEVIANRSHLRIYALLKHLAHERDEDRLVFREGRNEALAERLARLQQRDLVKIDTNKREFLEFLTSAEVTRVLVRDISLTSEYYGYQHTPIQFRKFSFAALKHLESYRDLVLSAADHREKSGCRALDEGPMPPQLDDNAFDGEHYFSREAGAETANSSQQTALLTNQQKQHTLVIFSEFLMACLNDSTEDSCRLWYNYVNFYLNYAGSLDQLEDDILGLVDSKKDCRMAITLYKAIHRDEMEQKSAESNLSRTSSALDDDCSRQKSLTSLHGGLKYETLKPESCENTARNQVDNLKSILQPYKMAQLFRNEFLVHLLEKTLNQLPGATDLDALSVVAMC